MMLAVLALLACKKPETTTEAPKPAPAVTAEQPAQAPAAPVDPKLLLSEDELERYLKALGPMVEGLRKADARFAAGFKGTAVSFDGLVTPETQAARDDLARANGFASWSDFSQANNKVTNAMGFLMAQMMRMMSIAGIDGRIKDLEKKLAEPGLSPEDGEKLRGALADLKKKAEAAEQNKVEAPNVPEANVTLVGKRHAEIARAFRATRGEKAPAEGAPADPHAGMGGMGGMGGMANPHGAGGPADPHAGLADPHAAPAAPAPAPAAAPTASPTPSPAPAPAQ
jgi:hypothetical protein